MRRRFPPAVRVSVAVIATVALAFALQRGSQAWTEWLSTSLPPVQPIDVYAMFVDDTFIDFTIRGGVAPWKATATELRTAAPVWRRMHVADWDTVEDPLRHESLSLMLSRYRRVLTSPAVWDGMSVRAWDDIPQPVRSVAYRQMVAYWAGAYDVGEQYGLDAATVRETLSAILMSESWFEHRAVSVSRDGNRDLGLAQASDFARNRLRELYLAGVVDVSFEDPEYFNPWKATRFLALWFKLLLDESDGDLDQAVRAYHRGTYNAGDEAGSRYFRTVQRRLRTFIRNRDASPAWSEVWELGRQIEAEEWPWLRDKSPGEPAASGSDTPARRPPEPPRRPTTPRPPKRGPT